MNQTVRTEDQTNDVAERFKERLDKALARIRDSMEDKEVNNIFFLILYELPYIFSDGKVIGGFLKTSPKQQEGELIDQPLNTLHLTERVIENDHFDEILSIFKVDGKPLKDLDPDAYRNLPSKCGHVDIQDYLGISNEEKNKKIFQDIIYLFINEVPANIKLYVIFNHTELLEQEILTRMWGYFDKTFLQQLSNEGTFSKGRVEAGLPIPCCVKTKKLPLQRTLSPVSSDNYLYTRDYLEGAIDNINQEIEQKIESWLDKEKEPQKGDGNSSMRSIFLRTARRDVNYLVPLLTRRMRTAILEKIRADKELFEYARTRLFSDFKEYKRLTEPPNNGSRSGSNVEQEMWCKYIDDPERLGYFLRDFNSKQDKAIDAKALHDELKDIKNELFKFLAPESKLDSGSSRGHTFVLKYDQNKREDCLKLLFVVNSFAETTPLVGGIAYTTGKRGTPYYSIGWKKGERGSHPFLKKLPEGSDEKELRYPSFMENFFDVGVMEADKFHISINIPVVCNGITFGVFAIYPGVEENGFLERKSDYLLELTKLVEKHRPDLLRSFFLDICANVTRILSGIERKKSTESTGSKRPTTYDLKELINKAQDLIRMAHEVPRTYIIHLGESNREEKIRSYFKERAFAPEMAGLIQELTEVTKQEDARFQFFEEHLAIVPELKENTLSCDNYASYKLLNVEDWWFIILQFNTKPAKKFSLRELNNNSYLCQAIETGLAGFKKRYEIIQHSTKAAMTAIMSRNLSHNIGSHVISYFIQELQNLTKDKKINEQSYSDEQKVIKKASDLFGYIQHRMDFIAEVSTTVPCSEVSLRVDDVFAPFTDPYKKYKDGFEKDDPFSALLNYLSYSEQSQYIAGAKDIIKRIDLHNCIEVSNPHSIDRISIPNGLVGTHALYSILENFIRNSSKHYGGNGAISGQFIQIVLREMNKSEIGRVSDETLHKKYATLEIWDMRDNSCDRSVGNKLTALLPGGNGYEYVDDRGQLVHEGWGIKEMVACANYLRKNAPKNLVMGITEPPLLEIICEMPHEKANVSCEPCPRDDSSYARKLGIRLYVRKPLDLLVVGVKKKPNGDKFAIDCLETLEFPLENEIEYRMLATNNSIEKETAESDPKAPCRIVELKPECDDAIDDEFYLRKYEGFIYESICRSIGLPKLVYLNGEIKGKEFKERDQWSYVEDSNLQAEKARDLIVFYYHLDKLCKDAPNIFRCLLEANHFVQPLSAGYSNKGKLDNLPVEEQLLRQFYLELVEAAMLEVVIVDERIDRWASREFAKDVPIRDILARMKIFVVSIDDIEKLSFEKLTRSILSAQELFSFQAIGGGRSLPSAHYFIIHQGILDKIKHQGILDKIEGMDERFMGEVLCRWKAVASGRGVPSNLREVKKARFLEISALQSILQNFDKHGLVQTLCSLRQPPHE